MKTHESFYYGKYVLLGIAAIFGFTLVIMWLWNALIPDIFKGPLINYWQAFGLLILSKILFSGIGKHTRFHPTPPEGSHRSDFYREHWRKKVNQKMDEKNEDYRPG
mgnify:CR=1 FL=1